MKEILRKLSSRKLWMAIAGVVTGIAMAVGVDGNEIGTISGAVTTLVSVVAYIATEGKIDAARVKNAVDDVQEAVNTIQGGEVSE